MDDDLVGQKHAWDTQEAYRKAWIADRVICLAADVPGNAIVCELFQALVFRKESPEDARQQILEAL